MPSTLRTRSPLRNARLKHHHLLVSTNPDQVNLEAELSHTTPTMHSGIHASRPRQVLYYVLSDMSVIWY